jgi:hypothetical protein
MSGGFQGPPAEAHINGELDPQLAMRNWPRIGQAAQESGEEVGPATRGACSPGSWKRDAWGGAPFRSGQRESVTGNTSPSWSSELGFFHLTMAPFVLFVAHCGTATHLIVSD